LISHHVFEKSKELFNDFLIWLSDVLFVLLLALLEKMGDVCHSLGKDKLKKTYLTQAYTIAGARNDLAAKASIKAKYKEKTDNPAPAQWYSQINHSCTIN